MANSVYVPQSKRYLVFLNISFVLLSCLFLKTHFFSPQSVLALPNLALTRDTLEGCNEFQKIKGYNAKCVYLKTHHTCQTSGYIDYLYLFYCKCGNLPVLGYTLVILWLLLLFYLLGDTASVYFCSSLESLSKLLNLSPTIAGVTLLSLGNGAPDLFASLVSFMGHGSDSVGANSVLGGAFFVSCIVVGVICVFAAPSRISVNKCDFVRDVCYLLFGLLIFLVIVLVGRINLWGALGFASLYVVYVVLVYKTQIDLVRNDIEDGVVGCNLSYVDELSVPILHSFGSEESLDTERQSPGANGDCGVDRQCPVSKSSTLFGWLCYFIELPLSLPRRLTIPVVFEEKWSKPYAVISVTLAPILLVMLCYSQMIGWSYETRRTVYTCVGLLGIFFGVLVLVTTNTSKPPQKFLCLWLLAGFVMSVTWSYIIANELVALLVSIGHIMGISPSILGLTVLAWGNSLGDLITNFALAKKCGPEGTQVAISGCYAGPIFNLLVGLGVSLIVVTWTAYPSSVKITKDLFLLETLAFLVIGLLWALVILPWRKMKLDRFLGVGLLVIYLGCVSLRVVQTITTG